MFWRVNLFARHSRQGDLGDGVACRIDRSSLATSAACCSTAGSLADTDTGCALLGVGRSGCGNAHVAAMAADQKRVAVVATVHIRAADQRQHPSQPGVR